MAHFILWISILGWGSGLTALTLFAIRTQKERLKWLKFATLHTVFGVSYLILLQFIFYLFTFLEIPFHSVSVKIPAIGLIGAFLLPLQYFYFSLMVFQGAGIKLRKRTRFILLAVCILLNSGAFYHYGHTFFIKTTQRPLWSWDLLSLSQLLVVLSAGTIPSLIALVKVVHKKQTTVEKFITLVACLHLSATPLHLISYFKYSRPAHFTGSEIYIFFFLVGIVYILFSIVSIVFNTKAIGKYLFPLPQELPEIFLQELSISPRESEVINHIIRGLRPAEISEELFISIRTVNAHIQSVYRKMGVSGRPALIKKLREYTHT